MGDITIANPFTNGETNINHTRLNAAINDATINNLAVTTAKLNDGAVTEAKLGNSSAKGTKVGLKSLIGHRLTLSTGVPVTTSDVTAATTLYLTPHLHNEISLFTGSEWRVYESAEISIAIPATTGTNYDVWCWYNSGTPTLELTAWTNDTTRATALARQDGVYVKSGDTARRYIGTIRTTAVSGQCEDSSSRRLVWNAYNQVSRDLRSADTTNSWNYTTATWREINGGSTIGTSRVVLVVGLAMPIVANVLAIASNGSNVSVATGVGIDSTSANSAQIRGGVASSGGLNAVPGRYAGPLSAGYHVISHLEISTASGTTTWYGDNAATLVQSGMQVEVLG